MIRRYPAVVLVSTDVPLIEAIERVIDSIGNLELMVLRGVDQARAVMSRDDLALALVHLECASDADEAIHLLRLIGEAKRSLPMLALSNNYRAEQALALLRAGVADY